MMRMHRAIHKIRHARIQRDFVVRFCTTDGGDDKFNSEQRDMDSRGAMADFFDSGTLEDEPQGKSALWKKLAKPDKFTPSKSTDEIERIKEKYANMYSDSKPAARFRNDDDEEDGEGGGGGGEGEGGDNRKKTGGREIIPEEVEVALDDDEDCGAYDGVYDMIDSESVEHTEAYLAKLKAAREKRREKIKGKKEAELTAMKDAEQALEDKVDAAEAFLAQEFEDLKMADYIIEKSKLPSALKKALSDPESIKDMEQFMESFNATGEKYDPEDFADYVAASQVKKDAEEKIFAGDNHAELAKMLNLDKKYFDNPELALNDWESLRGSLESCLDDGNFSDEFRVRVAQMMQDIENPTEEVTEVKGEPLKEVDVSGPTLRKHLPELLDEVEELNKAQEARKLGQDGWSPEQQATLDAKVAEYEKMVDAEAAKRGEGKWDWDAQQKESKAKAAKMIEKNEASIKEYLENGGDPAKAEEARALFEEDVQEIFKAGREKYISKDQRDAYLAEIEEARQAGEDPWAVKEKEMQEQAQELKGIFDSSLEEAIQGGELNDEDVEQARAIFAQFEDVYPSAQREFYQQMIDSAAPKDPLAEKKEELQDLVNKVNEKIDMSEHLLGKMQGEKMEGKE